MCFSYVEMGSVVEVTVNLDHTELLDNQVLPIAHHLTKERHIPIPVFQDNSSHVYRAVNVTNWHHKHLGAITHLDWPTKRIILEICGETWNTQ